MGEYSTRTICALTSKNDIELREIAKGKKPTAIFLVTDDRQKSTNVLCTFFVNNLISELMDAAKSNSGKSLARDFLILADEFANMPPLDNMSQKITTLRSYRIWMLMAVQSLQQLNLVYGNENAEIIKNNCGYHIFLGGNDMESKDRFSKSMGRTIGISTSVNINGEGYSMSRTTVDIPVVKVSDLENLRLGEFYVKTGISSGVHKNFKSYMLPYFMQNNQHKSGRQKMPLNTYNPNENVYDIYKIVEAEQSQNNQKAPHFEPKNDVFSQLDEFDLPMPNSLFGKAPSKSEDKNKIYNEFKASLKNHSKESVNQIFSRLTIIPELLSDVTNSVFSCNDVIPMDISKLIKNLNVLKFMIIEEFITNNNFRTKKEWDQKILEECKIIKEGKIFPEIILKYFDDALNEVVNELSLKDIKEIKRIINSDTD